MTIARRALSQQIAEVDRELALRRQVYPGLVVRGKMRQSEADEHLVRMEAVSDTLRWLQQHAATIKASVEIASEVTAVLKGEP